MVIKKIIKNTILCAGLMFLFPALLFFLIDFYDYIFCSGCEVFLYTSLVLKNVHKYLFMDIIGGFLVSCIIVIAPKLTSKIQKEKSLK